MNEAALRAYFSEPMGNASIPPEKFVAQPYEMYNERGELITVAPLQPLQYKYLGLGAQVAIQEWLISHEFVEPVAGWKVVADLEKRQMALEVLLKARGLEIPDPELWRNPVMPYGWHDIYERLLVAVPRKNVAEMSHGGKSSQTGEAKKKVRKFRKISPKPRKIKS